MACCWVDRWAGALVCHECWLFQLSAPVSPRKQSPHLLAPEADFSRKEFNWCPVTPILFGPRLRQMPEPGMFTAGFNPVPSPWRFAHSVERL